MRTRILVCIFFYCGFFCLGGVSYAQQSISVSLSGGSVQWNNSFGNALTPGRASNPGNTSITITTTWKNLLILQNLRLYAYFNSSIAALAHGSLVCTTGCPDIPSSAIELKINAGAFTPVTGTGPFGAPGASLTLLNITILLNGSSSNTSTLTFNINLSALPQLPADTYSGTLQLQAQATP